MLGELAQLIWHSPPVALVRGILDASSALARTGLGVALGPLLERETPAGEALREGFERGPGTGLLMAPLWGPAALAQSLLLGLREFGGTTREEGLLRAAEEAQARWEEAPLPGGGYSALARRAGRLSPLLGSLLAPAQWLDERYQRGAEALGSAIGQAVSAAAGRLPLLAPSPVARIAAQADWLRDLLDEMAGLLGRTPAERARQGGSMARLLHDLAGGLRPESPAALAQFERRAGELAERLREELAQAYRAAGREVPEELAQWGRRVTGEEARWVLGPEELADLFFARIPGFQALRRGPEEERLIRVNRRQLTELHEALAPLLREYDHDLERLTAGLGYLARKYGVRGLESTEEAIAAARLHGVEGLARQFEAIRDRWAPFGVDLVRDPSEEEALVRRYLGEWARAQGLTPRPPGALAPLVAVTDVLRQLAVTSPRYHILNITDAALKSLIRLGELGFLDLGPLVGRATEVLRGERPVSTLGRTQAWSPGIQRFLEETGLRDLPEVVLRTKSEEAASALERLPGALGAIFRLSREVGIAIDASSRAAAFRAGYLRQMAEELPALGQDLGELLVRAGLPDDAAASIRAVVEGSGGRLSPQRLETLLAELGAQPEVIAEGLRRLARAQAEAIAAGKDLARALHFDTRMTTRLDEYLRHLLFFHYWASRNIPFYLETFLTHPGLFQAFRRYQEETGEHAEREGIRRPAQERAVELGAFGRLLMERLLGREGEAYLDPTRYIGILGQLFDTPNFRGEESGLGQAVDVLSQLGFGANPLLGAILNITGLMGGRPPQALLPTVEPFLRAAFQALTGTVPQLPTDALQRARPLGGRSFDPELAVRLRLAQRAVEETGRVNPPEFITAALAGPQHPEYRAAASQVGQQQFLEFLLSFLGLPITFRGATEAAIGRAQAGLPEVPPDVTGLERELLMALRREELWRRARQGQPLAVAYEGFWPGRPQVDLTTPAGRQQLVALYLSADAPTRAYLWRDPLVRAVLEQALAQRRIPAPVSRELEVPTPPTR